MLRGAGKVSGKMASLSSRLREGGEGVGRECVEVIRNDEGKKRLKEIRVCIWGFLGFPYVFVRLGSMQQNKREAEKTRKRRVGGE